MVHSNADTLGDGRLSAPSAVRNAGAIVAALEPVMPARGTVLEIAAGTGQHAVALAAACPQLVWQPTDIAPERRASIDAWAKAAALPNIRPAAPLDASAPGWREGPVEMIFLANLLHIITREAAQNVLAGIARSLAPGGIAALYGPFRTEGGFRSESDARFHAALCRDTPDIGYKDAEWVASTAKSHGLTPRPRIEMPANNLILLFEK